MGHHTLQAGRPVMPIEAIVMINYSENMPFLETATSTTQAKATSRRRQKDKVTRASVYLRRAQPNRQSGDGKGEDWVWHWLERRQAQANRQTSVVG
jgi:hypothetical protein